MNTKHTTNLSTFSNHWYNPGSAARRALWYVTSIVFFNNPFLPFSTFKCALLRLFGASVGSKVVIKPSVKIKYPWKLTVGDNTWIGEEVWIDNLGQVTIGANVCISQGALLLCGNHDYKKTTFDLMVGDITLEDGAWVGAKSIVTGNVTICSHAILTAGSVANANLEAYTICKGNPAVAIRERKIEA
ncbi:MAG: WcaF family extracellular polysaccharide biosynthesis acetyltransferase [Flavobacteriales bacterium]|jgi:putative colanic acid biosynthesis acetyltransferase WcaF|nr:WcaF family extracellular polysaccharide biosynthesis acetyltransferase [Flavobacteriales bacterium]